MTIFVTSSDSEKYKMILMNHWYNMLKEAHSAAVKRENTVLPLEQKKLSKHGSIFKKLQFSLELGDTTYEAKKHLREQITSNGGQISYILNGNTDYLIVCERKTSTSSKSYKIHKARELGIPIVREIFITECIENDKIVDFLDYVHGKPIVESYSAGKILVSKAKPKEPSERFEVEKVIKYKVDAGDCPVFPDNFQVAKYSILAKITEERTPNDMYCVETQVGLHDNCKTIFRVMVSYKNVSGVSFCHVYPVQTSSEVVQCYESLVKQFIADGFKKVIGIPGDGFSGIASAPLSLLLNEMKISSGIIHPEVARLVESAWLESLCEIMTNFGVEPFTIHHEQIRNAMIVLMQIKNSIKRKSFKLELSNKFYQFIPQRDGRKELIDNMQKITKMRELCQLLKDITLSNETSWISKDFNDRLSQYTALKCAIMWIDSKEKEYKLIKDLLPDNIDGKGYKVQNIFRVSRSVENSQFKSDIGNTKLLFHASHPHNFVGILSRGLMLPLTLSSEYGVSRSDEGNLGAGIYFSDSFEMSLKFTARSQSRGSRIMLVNEVALGKVFYTKNPMTDLIVAPEGHHSVKGTGLTKFDDVDDIASHASEYAIYDARQQKLRYLIEFTTTDDIMTIYDRVPVHLPFKQKEDKQVNETVGDNENFEPKVEEVRYGLIMESKDISAILEEVHIRAKVIDLVSEVTIFQSYINMTNKTVEAKYVFPLTENAAVCGFEAFINDKHVIGEVKEKEQAQKEYKKAVSEGHGAYLMDEEKPNVFSVSVGNIPPAARVIIKISYVAELETTNEPDSNVLFTLPGSIAQWEEKSVLLSSSATQEVTESTSVSNEKKSSVIISIDMPFDILDITSPTHKIVTKKTSTKACVKLQKSIHLDGNNFHLLIKVAEIHVPRIWIEKENEESKDQVAMVTFFPEFEFDAVENFNCTVMLDMSNSMEGSAASHSKHLCSLLIDNLPDQCDFNVISFGSYFEETFIRYENASTTSKKQAKDFITCCTPSFGGSDLFYILNSVFLLQNNSCNNELHNIFLFSDGHLSEEERLLGLCKEISKTSHCQTRIFTFAVGNSPDNHTLQSLSILTGGSHEQFLSSSKRTWKRQLNNQLFNAKQPALTDVHIDWCNYDKEFDGFQDPTVLQVPEKVKCLFSGSQLVAYSYVPNCLKATLSANINGKEFSTMVNANELCKITGMTLHRLAAKAVFKEHDCGRLADDALCDQMLKEERKSIIISLSVKYSVVSKYTSFVAIEKRKPGEDLSITCGPSLSDLVDESFIDIISEVTWGAEEKSVEENVDELLKKSLQMQSSSILQSRNLVLEAKALHSTLEEKDPLRKLRIFATLCKLNVFEDNFNGWTEMKNLLLTRGKVLNFDVINAITNAEDLTFLQDLFVVFKSCFPEHWTIQLSSVPKKFQALSVGAFSEIVGFCEDFPDCFEKVSIFWEKFRKISCHDEKADKNLYFKTKELIRTFKSSILPLQLSDISEYIEKEKTVVGRLCAKSRRSSFLHRPHKTSLMSESSANKSSAPKVHSDQTDHFGGIPTGVEGTVSDDINRNVGKAVIFSPQSPLKTVSVRRSRSMKKRVISKYTPMRNDSELSPTSPVISEKAQSSAFHNISLKSAQFKVQRRPIASIDDCLCLPDVTQTSFQDLHHDLKLLSNYDDLLSAASKSDDAQQQLNYEDFFSDPCTQEIESISVSEFYGFPSQLEVKTDSIGVLEKEELKSSYSETMQSSKSSSNGSWLSRCDDEHKQVNNVSHGVRYVPDYLSEEMEPDENEEYFEDFLSPISTSSFCDTFYTDLEHDKYADASNILGTIMKRFNLSESKLVDGLEHCATLGGFWRFPDEETISSNELSPAEYQMLSLFRNVVISAGAQSLGSQVLSLVTDMLLTAIVLEILKLVDDGNNMIVKNMLERGKKWLKYVDTLNPSLYKRLELGSSWEMAAKLVINQLSEKLLEVTDIAMQSK
nr:protein mono-ADP-ribosyltransferase PARP4-like isoform X4 [Styela clava]